MKDKFKLFLIMFKIGLFTFGGGYAMVSIVENEIVTRKAWISHDEFLDMLAISESTPGPIAVNSATYIGYKLGKVWGAIFATLGVVLPSFIVISLVYLVYDIFSSITLVAAAFKGIQTCVVFLIFMSAVKMWKKLEKNVFNYIISISALIVILCFSLFSIDFSAIYYILISALISLIINTISKIKKKEVKNNDIS